MRPAQALAASRRASWAGLSASVAALASSATCGAVVALAIGAPFGSFAEIQASATCPGVACCSAAVASRAANTRSPRASRYLARPGPRGVLAKSAALRYLPVRKPAARA